jgi:hypothetical protein
MISLCTVVVGTNNHTENNEFFESIFIDSVLNKLNLVSEILICKIDAPKDFYEERIIDGKKIIKFGYSTNFFYEYPEVKLPPLPFDWNDYNQAEKYKALNYLYALEKETISNIFINKIRLLGHPLGMKCAIDKAKNNLLFLCDPDIFFYTEIDKFYLDIMGKYDLSYVGASPHLALQYSTKYFPNILCMLTKKDSLPDETFLENKIITQDTLCKPCCVPTSHYYKYPEYLNGEYLIGTKIESIAKEFINPTGIFDTGVYLWLWAQKQSQNWLSFTPTDIHTYTSKIYRTNLKIKDRLPNHNLFYHATGGSRSLYNKEFMEEYKGVNDNIMRGNTQTL